MDVRTTTDEELVHYLRNSFENNGEDNDEKLLAALNELARRRNAAQLTAKTVKHAWMEFQQHYMPSENE